MASRALSVCDVSDGRGERYASSLLVVPGTDRGVAIDGSIWRDEERMKREIVAWAKAVASYSISVSSSHSRYNCK